MTVEDLILKDHPKLGLENQIMEIPPCDLSLDKSCATPPKDLTTPIVAETSVTIVKEDVTPKKKTCCEKMKSFITPENALKAAIGFAGVGLIYVIAKK